MVLCMRDLELADSFSIVSVSSCGHHARDLVCEGLTEPGRSVPKHALPHMLKLSADNEGKATANPHAGLFMGFESPFPCKSDPKEEQSSQDKPRDKLCHSAVFTRHKAERGSIDHQRQSPGYLGCWLSGN